MKESSFNSISRPVETLKQFRTQSKIACQIGRAQMAYDEEGKIRKGYFVTLSRPLGPNVRIMLFPDSPTYASVIDACRFLLAIDNWREFMRWRRDGSATGKPMNFQEIAAEWNSYQIKRKQLIEFFTDEERTVIALGFIEWAE